MKYVLAVLAIVAAVAALFFRPPQMPTGSGFPVASMVHASSGPAAGGDHGGTAAAPRGGRGRLDGAASSRPRQIVVYVAGEVAKPGVYALPAGARAENALARAGGAKPDADLVAVNLAEPLDDGVEVAVPKLGEPARRSRRSAHPRRRSTHGSRGHGGYRGAGAAAPAQFSLDLNTTDADSLQAVPGIGPALAARIVEYRARNGRFASVDELADISGITPRLQAELAQYVTVR